MNNIKLRINKDELLNEFNEEDLNPSLGEYILSKCHSEDIKNGVNIDIELEDDLKNENTEKINKLIQDYFNEKYLDAKDEYNSDKLGLNILLISGIIFLIIYYVIEHTENVFVVSELFLIMGWVALEELVYQLFFTKKDQIRHLKILKMLKEVKIKYE
jgi:hypothetical protein